MNKSILDIASILRYQYDECSNVQSLYALFTYCKYNIYYEKHEDINKLSNYLSYSWHYCDRDSISHHINIIKKINSIDNKINIEPIPKYYWSFNDNKIFTKKLAGE
jgi:hypothetical protein